VEPTIDIAAYNKKIFAYEWDSLVFLIAEDVDVNFLLLRDVMKKTGVQLVHVINGQEAVDIIGSDQQVDIFLTDIQMPVMDGFTATRQAHLLRPDLPIIAYTAYTYEGVTEKILIAGAKECLIKPFDNRTLLNSIRKYLFRS